MDKEEYLYETGEVYYVDFPYEEKDGKSKQRPVLVILEKNDDGNIKCAKITGSTNRKKQYDFVLKDREHVGLDKESLVELNRIELVNEKEFFKKIGEISDDDLETMFTNLEAMAKGANKK